MKNIKTYLLYFLILVYVSGSIGFIIKPSFFAPFTPLSLLLTCGVFLIHQPINKNYMIGFVMVSLIGFISELIGIKTGLIFGNYHYGSGLGTKLEGVPIIISLNWALIVTAALGVSHKLFENKYVIAFCTAAIATGIDLLMEQVAPKLNFWFFDTGIAGLHNYIGWFAVSFLASALFYDYLKKTDYKVSAIILALQLLFFGIIYTFN